MPAPNGYSSLLFDDAFAGSALNTSKWNTYITSNAANGWPWNSNGAGGSSNGSQYDAEYFEPSAVSVNNGLQLTATRGSSQPGYTWTSGVVCTYNHFQFTGGYLQVKAQLPAGNGMWSGLWMLPGPGGTAGDNFEVDLLESGYPGNGVSPDDNDAWHLHTPSGTFGGTANTGKDLTTGYHVYGLAWVPGQSITWYVDGVQIARLTSAQAPIPDEPMEVILSQQVANANTSGWHTVVDSTTPSPSTLKVAEVQVWQ